jgi:hypothetical protein
VVAQKLDVRGAFGAPSNEYLNYAMKNRMEREEKGVEVVAEMLETYGASQLKIMLRRACEAS